MTFQDSADQIRRAAILQRLYERRAVQETVNPRIDRAPADRIAAIHRLASRLGNDPHLANLEGLAAECVAWIEQLEEQREARIESGEAA